MVRDCLSTSFYNFVALFSHLLYIQSRKGMGAMLKLYENIKDLRKQNNWTQEELAQKIGYTDRSAIAKIEAGKIDLPQSKIIEFADVFGVEPGDLMGWNDFEIVHDGNIIYDKEAAIKELLTDMPNRSDIVKAVDLYKMYENATPEVQSAVELLLKSAQQPSESHQKN